MLCVQTLPAVHDVGPVAGGDRSHLGRGRGTAKLHEARVGQVTQREVVFIHPVFQPLGTGPWHAGPEHHPVG